MTDFRFRHTPAQLTELLPYEVVVFGSDLAGEHTRGDARTALERYGAVRGNGRGLYGQSYALPVSDYHQTALPLPAIRVGIEDLLDCARLNACKCFMFPRVVHSFCEYDASQICELVYDLDLPHNVIIPIEMQRQLHTRRR